MAEEVIEIPSRVEHIRRRIQPLLEEPNRTHILVGAAALAIGAGVGYLIGKKNRYVATIEIEDPHIHADPNQMRLEFDEDALARELRETRELLEDVRTKRAARQAARAVKSNVDISEEDREDVEDLVIEREGREVVDFVEEKLRSAMTTTPGALDPEDPPVVTDTIFAEDDDDWDYELEKMQRSKTEPYILHKDEFYAEELGYTQTTLTYYEGDDIMADQEDAPVYNYQRVTGPLKFGHGSGDPNVLYVRNDKYKAEYEIIHDSGLFSVEVMGLEIPNNERVRDRPRDRDLRHSEYRKFRLRD